MRNVTARGLVLVLLTVLSLGLLAACGGDDDADVLPAGDDPAMEEPSGEGAEAPAGDATVVEIPAAGEGFAFAVESATAPAGPVTLSMPNPSPLPHNIAVEEPEAAEGEVVGEGEVSEITVDFPAGEYEYFCTVPGHREGGMVGTLTVE